MIKRPHIPRPLGDRQATPLTKMSTSTIRLEIKMRYQFRFLKELVSKTTGYLPRPVTPFQTNLLKRRNDDVGDIRESG
jgi:hypothetical protein